MSLQQAFFAVLRGWRIVIGLFLTALLLSVLVAITSKPVYRSEVTLTEAPEDGASGGLAGLAGQAGGLAALAGFSISKGGNFQQALATLRSRHLIEALVIENKLLPVLYSDKWNETKNAWKENSGRVPSLGDAVLMFRNRVLQVREDTKSGVVTVRIDWRDPELASQWANYFVEMADKELRENAISSADASLYSLSHELAGADQVELRAAISKVMEAQVRAKVFAKVHREYAFHVIDAAVPSDPDKRVQPTRAVMVLAGGLGGLIFGVLVVLLRTEWQRRST